MGFTAYTRAAKWLYEQLNVPPIDGVSVIDPDADPVATAVFEGDAPEGSTSAESTWITFEAMDPGSDLAEVAAHRVWTELTFLVRVMRRGRSINALEPIVDEIDNRLHRKDGVIDDARVLSCTRQEDGGSEFPESELRQGVEYRGLGAAYSLLIQPL
jgi:hypothetical protein